MFEELFEGPIARARQCESPFPEERRRFLSHLKGLGYARRSLKAVACELIVIATRLDLSSSNSLDAAVVEAAARLLGIPRSGGILDDLQGRELLVQITPGTARAVEFAQAIRPRSLLTGLGRRPDDASLYGIGLPGAELAAAVPGFAYELWKWGHACDSLWHASQIVAASGRAIGADDPDVADPGSGDPEQVLDRCLSAIQLLLAHGVIYLDEAREQ